MSDAAPILLDSRHPGFASRLDALRRAQEADQEVVEQVSRILREVRERGDPAVLEYTRRFDRHDLSAGQMEVSTEQIAAAARRIPKALHTALQQAAGRIEDFHQRQRQQSWSFQDQEGNTLGQRVRPLARVGVYVPGGSAAYPSSVLMNVIPARVAGVEEIIMTVPTPGGQLNDAVLAAARLAGVSRIFTVGGAQAIAALAWGTEHIPRVDKIVGPGNIWVATAKRLVFGHVGIDMIAGPTEVLIVADKSADPQCLVMDMFAQLEHDVLAAAFLVSPDEALLEQVASAIPTQLPKMERAAIIGPALANSALIRTPDLHEAIAVANQLAPEHLELAVDDPDALLDEVQHAGAIFLGHWSAEVFGDYCAGPNHVLPTGGTARFSSPLGVHDFQKFSSLVQCTRDSVQPLVDVAGPLAEQEGLFAHARSARLRGR